MYGNGKELPYWRISLAVKLNGVVRMEVVYREIHQKDSDGIVDFGKSFNKIE
jgi:hypothetical protein